MIDSIEWIRAFIFTYRSLQYLIIFVGTAVTGEIGLFAVGFLMAQGVLPVFPSVIVSFIGTFVPNILWFLVGKTETVNKIVSHRYANTTISTMVKAVGKFSKNNHFLALIVAKFLVGTPVILVMYSNQVKMRLGQFLYYETPAILLSLLVIIPLGFVSGFGFAYVSDIFENLFIAVGFILSVIIIMVAVQLWLKRKFTKMEV